MGACQFATYDHRRSGYIFVLSGKPFTNSRNGEQNESQFITFVLFFGVRSRQLARSVLKFGLILDDSVRSVPLLARGKQPGLLVVLA